MNETPTPRTDAQVALENPVGIPGNSALISTSFARQLERELAAEKARADVAAGHRKWAIDQAQRLRSERDAALAQVAMLREAGFICLEALKHNGYDLSDAGAAMRKALAATPETKHLDTELTGEIRECAVRIREIIDEEDWPKDTFWCATIRAHACTIFEDAAAIDAARKSSPTS